MVLLVAFIWYVIGITGFIYYWTSRNDLTADLNLIVTLILSGVLGVFTWVAGAIVCSPKTHKILIKRRRR